MNAQVKAHALSSPRRPGVAALLGPLVVSGLAACASAPAARSDREVLPAAQRSTAERAQSAGSDPARGAEGSGVSRGEKPAANAPRNTVDSAPGPANGGARKGGEPGRTPRDRVTGGGRGSGAHDQEPATLVLLDDDARLSIDESRDSESRAPGSRDVAPHSASERTPDRNEILRTAQQEETLRAMSERQLLAELERRILREWEVLTSDSLPTEDLALDFDALRLQAARRVLALRLLHEGTELDDTPTARLEAVLDQALALLQAAGVGPPSRLLAAAFLARRGIDDDLVSTMLAAEDGREAGSLAETPRTEAFHIATLSFAHSIRGPGDYTARPASQVGPGVLVLVYGEFGGFASIDAPARPDGDAKQTAESECAFAATLTLVDPADKEVNRLEFLPPGRGRQTLASADEIVNFWAQYRVPEDLPAGRYRIRVDARDLIGDETASREIEFRVKN